MAEFPALGTHCEVESCKQLDFLPFVCNGCFRTYCLEHRSKASHSCTDIEQEKQRDLAKLVAATENHQKCAFEDCRSHELVPVICKHCHNNYCFRHRHEVDHQCSGLPQKQTRVTPEERIQQIIGKDLNKEKKGQGGMRNESRAAKVSLMKIKMKATGDCSIPQDERIYLRVLMPLGSKQREQPMFFSKHWTIGKLTDKIAEAAQLRNENNVNAVERKLRLIHRHTGELLIMQDTLELLQTRDDYPVLSGSTVIIEYVDKECTTILPELHKYPT